jgi:transcriptional regulator with XRE-family HTH domain
MYNLYSMADVENRLLGSAIRRRRVSHGLQQRELAEAIGLATVVYGRIELGSRPVRATELRAIARELGTTADDLLEEVVPVPDEEFVERAVTMRDAAYGALREYANAALSAVRVIPESRAGVRPEGAEDTLRTTEDVLTFLAVPNPGYTGLTVSEEQAPVVRRVWEDLIAAIPVKVKGEGGDAGE